MVSVNVYRSPCTCYTDTSGEIIASDECYTGDEISDDLIITDEVAISRGTAEIDYNSTNRVSVSGAMQASDFYVAGTTVLYSDPEQGDFPSVVEACGLSLSRSSRGAYTATINIRLEREE